MRYTVEVLIRNLETGAVNITQRTVSLEREKSSMHPHDPLPIDSAQKDRLLRWAISEAAEDAVKDRDRSKRPPVDYRPQTAADKSAQSIGEGKV